MRLSYRLVWALLVGILLPAVAQAQQPVGSGGTVSSVSIITPSWLAVSPPTISTTGIFQFTTPQQAPSMFLASPAAVPGPLTPRVITPQDLPLGSSAAPGALQCGTNLFCSGGVISAIVGNGNISGPSSAVVGYVPLWANTGGTSLAQGLPIGTIGNSTIVQTNSAGTILAPINTTNGVFGGLTATGSFTATGLVSSADLAAGAALQNIGNLATGQFIGYANGGAGPAQPVTLQAGLGTSINCAGTVCTIGATGTGVVGPGTTINGYVPQWASATGAALGPGFAVGTSGVNTIVQTGSGGFVNNSIISSLPNSSLAAGAAASNIGNVGGALTGTLPNPTLANITTNIIPKASIGALANSSMNDAGAGITVGSPTGGAEGAGSINATGLFVNGVPVGTGNASITGLVNGQVPVANSATSLNASIPYGTGGAAILIESNASGNLATNFLPALTGDISSSSGSNSAMVTGIQGRSFSSMAPANGQVPIYSSTSNSWVPQPIPSGVGSSGNGQLLANNSSAVVGYTIGSVFSTSSGTLSIANSAISAPLLGASAAAANIGNVGGALTGTLPNPSLAAGVALNNLGNLANAQFVGYGSGTGSGPAQAVTLQAGSGASLACTNQVCTIGATGSGGISGPSTTVVGYAPLWNSGTGNALSSGIPVAQTGASTIVETNSGGQIANSLIASLPNSSLANSQITIGSNAVALGGTIANISGLTLTAPTINNGSITGSTVGNPTFTGTATFQNVAFSFGNDTPGDLYYRSSTGLLTRLGISSGILTDVGGLPAWAAAPITGINALTQDVTATGTGSQVATVVGIQTRPVSATAPTLNQFIGWNGSAWIPMTNVSGINALTQDVTATGTGSQAATVVGIQGRPFSATAPTVNQVATWGGSSWAPANAQITGINALTQDVTASGTGSQVATVVGIQGRPFSSVAPTTNQIATWNGSTWLPAAPPISGINALTKDVSATGTGSQAATVTGLQGRPISITTPTTNQMLGWNGSAWAPESTPPATGVTSGAYTVASAGGVYYCLTLNPSGQATSMTSGQCSATAVVLGVGSGNALGVGSGNALGI